MIEADLPPSLRRVRSRRIEESDVSNVVDLLTRGFDERHPRRFWERVLGRLGNRASPAHFPRYGYVLERDGALIGALLQIFSTVPTGRTFKTRCNVSSWYVDPAARPFAPLLVSQALRHEDVTYLNISAAPHTRAIAEAQGYARYSNGVFVAVPALSPPHAGTATRIVDARTRPDVPFDPHERDLLLEHAEFGCVGLWCITPERAYPFIFRPRLVKKVVSCAQLIYCRDLDDFVRFARPLPRVARAAFGHRRRQWPDPGPGGPVFPRHDAKIFPRARPAPAGRPRLHGNRAVRRLAPAPDRTLADLAVAIIIVINQYLISDDRRSACISSRYTRASPLRMTDGRRLGGIERDPQEPTGTCAMNESTTCDFKRLPFETAIAELETIVLRLEQGDLKSSETRAIYERGQALKRHCAGLIDKILGC
jgi:exodeoxyribonuclease VII small subunit